MLKERAATPVRPNAGFAIAYRKKLYAMIDRMARSYMRWVMAAYRSNPPAVAELTADMAMDAASASVMKKVLDELKKKWMKDFDEGSVKLAKWFAQAAHKRSDAQLKKILKDAGFSIGDLKMTKAQKDVLQAAIEENVSLIKSIPAQFHQKIEGDVMRSVATGGDQGQLVKKLQKTYKTTKKRAKLIAKDQNSKATSSMTKARQVSLGIKYGIWQHSHAGKEPRPSHLANDGNKFSLEKGWFDPDEREWIMPGQLINCRCTWSPIIPELED